MFKIRLPNYPYSLIKLSLLTIISLSFFMFFNVDKVLAINNCNDGWRISSGPTREIDCHGVCKEVKNDTCGKDIFVPTKTPDEWLQFRTNKPGCVSLSGCVVIACYNDSGCDDGDYCTSDICYNDGTVSSYCSNPAANRCGDGTCNCGETSSSCSSDCGVITCYNDSECDDGNYCTSDTCYNDGTTSSYCSNPAANRCGDGTCNCGETSSSCSSDCGFIS
jgi:hypothetical protein